MTPEQRNLIKRLRKTPTQEPLPLDEFLRRYPAEDGRALALELAREAETEDDLDSAFLVAARFEAIDSTWAPVLARLTGVDWHHEHEYLVDLLAELRDPTSVEALTRATTWAPDYLEWDDNRNFATKAIWGLRKNPSPAAHSALVSLTASHVPVIAETARDRLLDRIEDDWVDSLQAGVPSDEEHRRVPLLLGGVLTEGVLDVHQGARTCDLRLTAPDGRQWQASNFRPWHALRAIRRDVEAHGDSLLVNGCRRTVYGSHRTMRTAYVLTLGQAWRAQDLVDIFAPAPPDTWATVSNQDDHHDQWLTSLLPWPADDGRHGQ